MGVELRTLATVLLFAVVRSEDGITGIDDDAIALIL